MAQSLRHIVGAPDLDWERWRALQNSRAFVGNTTSPALVEFPAVSVATARTFGRRLIPLRHRRLY